MNNVRVLLDTNIVIHRENKKVSNYSIGLLYRWIDRLNCDKVIHPYTISEIRKYRDPETQEAISVKLEAYETLKTTNEPTNEFLNKIGQPEKNENDLDKLRRLHTDRPDYNPVSGAVAFFGQDQRKRPSGVRA